MNVTFTRNEAGIQRVEELARSGVERKGRDIAADASPPERTGALRRSITVERDSDGVVSVVANVPYAAKIERNSPFLVPSLQRRF